MPEKIQRKFDQMKKWFNVLNKDIMGQEKRMVER